MVLAEDKDPLPGVRLFEAEAAIVRDICKALAKFSQVKGKRPHLPAHWDRRICTMLGTPVPDRYPDPEPHLTLELCWNANYRLRPSCSGFLSLIQSVIEHPNTRTILLAEGRHACPSVYLA